MRTSSTIHYLIKILDKRKTSAVCTFIDLCKTFDSVSHPIILTKAASVGIKECLILWLSDFLSGCRHAVPVQGEVSCFPSSVGSEPQGTMTAPLCFLLLINDALLDKEHRLKYFGDSTITTAISSTSQDYSHFQYTLNNFLD